MKLSNCCAEGSTKSMCDVVKFKAGISDACDWWLRSRLSVSGDAKLVHLAVVEGGAHGALGCCSTVSALNEKGSCVREATYITAACTLCRLFYRILRASFK